MFEILRSLVNLLNSKKKHFEICDGCALTMIGRIDYQQTFGDSESSDDVIKQAV